MAAVIKLAPINSFDEDDRLSTAELLARFSGPEIFSASQETSRIFNGCVIAKAVVIVQTLVHCSSLLDLARRLHVSKSTLYRQVKGLPLSDPMFYRAIRDLALLLEEEGVYSFNAHVQSGT